HRQQRKKELRFVSAAAVLNRRSLNICARPRMLFKFPSSFPWTPPRKCLRRSTLNAGRVCSRRLSEFDVGRSLLPLDAACECLRSLLLSYRTASCPLRLTKEDIESLESAGF